MSRVKPFTPTPEHLGKGIVHICYEYANLMSAAHWSMNGCAPWRTHADDAFLLGCRKVGDFFLKPRSKRFGIELPDVLAMDYLKPGLNPNLDLPIWTKEWRDAMDRQLAHLSYVRDKSWNHEEWVPKLEKEFRSAWRKFRRAVNPIHKKAFATEIANCRRKQGFAGIKL